MALSDVFGNVSSRWNITMKKLLASVSDNALAIFKDYGINFNFGSSDSQANAVYSKEHTIALSATLTLNLDDDSLKDLFGDNFSLAKVKGFRIIHLPTSAASSVKVLRDWVTTVFGASTAYPLVKGACWHHQEPVGLAVVTTSADEVKITNNDGSNAATVIVEFLGS